MKKSDQLHWQNHRAYNGQRGLCCEARVAEALCSRGFILCHHRLRTPFAEIDLVFANSIHLRNQNLDHYLIEVKSVLKPEAPTQVVSERQMWRLRRAWIYWQETYRSRAQFWLAMVDQQGKITWIQDFLS